MPATARDPASDRLAPLPLDQPFPRLFPLSPLLSLLPFLPLLPRFFWSPLSALFSVVRLSAPSSTLRAWAGPSGYVRSPACCRARPGVPEFSGRLRATGTASRRGDGTTAGS